ncbi:unnamed protein product [Coregonus sp. 'balchen']|nr:unnamed protein product [Coregonus sp. 'balchen']
MEGAAKMTPLTPPSPFLSSQARWDTTPDEWGTFREYRSVLNPPSDPREQKDEPHEYIEQERAQLRQSQQAMQVRLTQLREQQEEMVQLSETLRSVLPQLTSQSIASLSPTKPAPTEPSSRGILPADRVLLAPPLPALELVEHMKPSPNEEDTACDGQYDNSEWPDPPMWPPAFDESLLPCHQSDTPSLQCGYQEPPSAAMSSLSPGAHSTCQEATPPPMVQLRDIPTCQLPDTPSVEYQPVDGARVCLPVPAIGSQFALRMGIQPVPDKVFQSATTKDPSVNKPKLINEVDSSVAPATKHQPGVATVVLQTNMVLQPSSVTGALPTPVLEPRPATTDGAHLPVKSDSLSARHEEQPSPPTRVQPASVIVDPMPPTRAAQLDLKVQPGPVFRSPALATESHRVAATGPQTAVDADHQPASPWLPPAAAQGSTAPVPISLPPAAAQGQPPGFTLGVIPFSVRGASPEANDKPPPAPDEEPSSSLATGPPLGPVFQTPAAHAVWFILTSAQTDQPSSVGEPPPGLEWEPSTGAASASTQSSHPVLASKVLSDPVGEPQLAPRRRPSATPPERPELDPDFWALQASALQPPLVPACDVHPGSVGEPQPASRREPSAALAQGPQSHPAWGALLPSLENAPVPAVLIRLGSLTEPFTLSAIELLPGPALGIKPAPANGAQSAPSFESQTVSAPETVSSDKFAHSTDFLLVAPTASDSGVYNIQLDPMGMWSGGPVANNDHNNSSQMHPNPIRDKRLSPVGHHQPCCGVYLCS